MEGVRMSFDDFNITITITAYGFMMMVFTVYFKYPNYHRYYTHTIPLINQKLHLGHYNSNGFKVTKALKGLSSECRLRVLSID